MHIYIMSYGACGKFHFFVLAIFSSKVFSHLILSSRVIYSESVENIEDVGVKWVSWLTKIPEMKIRAQLFKTNNVVS